MLAVASAGGLLGLHLLAEDIFPTWAESAPLCLTDDTFLLGVRSEVRYLVPCLHLASCTALPLPTHRLNSQTEWAAVCP